MTRVQTLGGFPFLFKNQGGPERISALAFFYSLVAASQASAIDNGVDISGTWPTLRMHPLQASFLQRSLLAGLACS